MPDSAFPHVIMGLWPASGVTTVSATPERSLATVQHAVSLGIRWFDTAFSYGYQGEADRLLAQLNERYTDARQSGDNQSASGDSDSGDNDTPTTPQHLHVIGKVGQRYTPDKQRIIDSTPATLIADAETSLQRAGFPQFDLLMLHSISPDVPVETSAEAMKSLQSRGITQAVGICNCDLEQLQRFADVVTPTAVQLPLNMLQQDILRDLVPWCRQHGVAVHVYWTLMKGILAGKISRDHQFAAGDSRPNYDIYQGEKRERVHRLVDRMVPLAAELGIPVAQLAIGWVLAQPGVTSALVGAHRPEQIEETAGSQPLTEDIREILDGWLAEEGIRPLG